MTQLMPQQTSKWFTKKINSYGCYFFCLLYGAAKTLNKPFKMYQIMEVYEKAIENKYMTFNCYIKNPAKILTLALETLGGENLRARYVGSERNGKLDIYNTKLENKINFTVDNIKILWEDKNGNLNEGSHFVNESYNPDVRLIPTGEILGHRYFYIGEDNEK